MSRLVDVTEDCSFGNNDDEALPLTKCKCGRTFALWDFILNYWYIQHPELNSTCPQCKCKLVFTNEIHVYEVIEDAPTG